MQRFLLLLTLLSSIACSSQTAETQKIEPSKKVSKAKNAVESYTRFHDNGALYIDGQKKDDKKIGIWSSWYKNGQLQSEVRFNNGKREGAYAAFFPNGKQRVIGQYHDEKTIGIWNFYDSTGVLIKTVDFDSLEKDTTIAP